jgi:hypothetical protein
MDAPLRNRLKPLKSGRRALVAREKRLSERTRRARTVVRQRAHDSF